MKTRCSGRQRRSFLLTCFFSFVAASFALGEARGATINLCDKLQLGGSYDLSSTNTYTLATQCNVSRSVTINGNGVAVFGTGPIVATGAGVVATFDHFAFTASSWGALVAVNGSHVVVQNSSAVSSPAGTAIYVSSGSTATVQASSLYSSQFGMQVDSASSAALHGASVTGCVRAVQVSGSGSSVSIDTDSLIDYTVNSGTSGVAVLNAATATVHDSTIRGYTNGIDIQGGTADVSRCEFENNATAVAAANSESVTVSRTTVRNAVTDGIYFANSRAVVDKSQVIGSLNTGISFIGCPSGTVQNTLVKNSAHQGIAVVAQDALSPPSVGIKVVNNTLVGNQIANLLVDDRSTALVQGNIFAKTPDYNIRLHGTEGITLDSALVVDSFAGLETYSSTQTIVLSAILDNQRNGVLMYNGAALAAEHSLFWNNGYAAPGGSSDKWSVFVTTGAQVTARWCSFGPAGGWGLYNLSLASCDLVSNYWGAADGPQVSSWLLPQGASNGSGSHLESGYQVSGPVTFTPFLSQDPVRVSTSRAVSFPMAGGLHWDSQLGMILDLTASQSSPQLTNEVLGVLKVNDTANLTLVAPPANLVPGEFYVVWASVPLLLNSVSGYLQFSVPSHNGQLALNRRGSDGIWTKVASIWDPLAHILTYVPSDVLQLSGTFALSSDPADANVVFVKKDGLCSGRTPCYASVQGGLGTAHPLTIMYVTQEVFSEHVVFNAAGNEIHVRGGWDATYSSSSSYSTIQGSVTITAGCMTIENLAIR